LAKTHYALRLRLEQVGPDGERLLMSSDKPAAIEGGMVNELGEAFAIDYDGTRMAQIAELAQIFAAVAVQAALQQISPRDMAKRLLEETYVAHERLRQHQRARSTLN